MIIKTVQTLVFEYPEDYQAEIEWNKKGEGDWVHQSTDTICSVYTRTYNYLIPTKAKHSFLDNAYFETEQTEPLPTAINGVQITSAVAWADKWLEDNPISEMWDMIRTLRDATEWQTEQTESEGE